MAPGDQPDLPTGALPHWLVLTHPSTHCYCCDSWCRWGPKRRHCRLFGGTRRLRIPRNGLEPLMLDGSHQVFVDFSVANGLGTFAKGTIVGLWAMVWLQQLFGTSWKYSSHAVVDPGSLCLMFNSAWVRSITTQFPFPFVATGLNRFEYKSQTTITPLLFSQCVHIVWVWLVVSIGNLLNLEWFRENYCDS